MIVHEGCTPVCKQQSAWIVTIPRRPWIKWTRWEPGHTTWSHCRCVAKCPNILTRLYSIICSILCSFHIMTLHDYQRCEKCYGSISAPIVRLCLQQHMWCGHRPRRVSQLAGHQPQPRTCCSHRDQESGEWTPAAVSSGQSGNNQSASPVLASLQSPTAAGTT